MKAERGLGLEVGGRRVSPRGVIHVGGHHGEEARDYQEHGAQTVVWIEAEPDAFAILKENVAAYPGHHCVQALAAEHDGEMRSFYRHRFRGGSKRGYCSTLPWNAAVVESDPVLSRLETFDVCSMRAITVGSALRERGFAPEQFQYLSINVQGAELMVLRGLGEYLAPIQWVFCEAELSADVSRYQGAPAVEEVADWLVAHGFCALGSSTLRQRFFYRTARVDELAGEGPSSSSWRRG